MKTTISHEEIISHVSGEYLTENLTVVEQLTEDSDEFVSIINERVIELYENLDASEVWELITNSAESLENFLKFKSIDIN